MRTPTRFSVVLAAALFSLPSLLAQTNPPPFDPHEMVTQEPRTLTKPADRSTAVDLLEHTRRLYDLRNIKTPYSLRVTFETIGAALSEGVGTMEEISDGGSHWRWSTELQDSRIVRIGSEGKVYGTNPDEPVPLRVQMLRAALHWPIVRFPGSSAMREAEVMRDGKQMTCLLLSGSIPPNPSPRSWVENEYCVDQATGLLQMWSDAPGIFAVYDYEGSSEFHGHILPRQLSIYEEGRLAVQARVESLADVQELNTEVFRPTPEMVEAGGSFMLATPNRFPMRVDPPDGPTSNFFQPVIVHAILDAQEGRVLDAEPLQTGDRELSRAAMDLVRSTTFPPTGFQQEVFINVQFHMPAKVIGGPPIFHTPVAWIIWEHRERVHPVKGKPVH